MSVRTSVDESTVSDVLLRALLSGETISRDKAMNIPAVASAVDLISSSIASMPVRLFKYKDEHVEEVTKDDRVAMLNGDTRDTLDGFQMKKALIIDYLLDGNGYCYIKKEGNDVAGLYYVDDRFIAISILDEPINKTYTIGCGGGMYQPFDFRDIFTSSLGCNNDLPISAFALLAITSFAFIFVCVPEPV